MSKPISVAFDTSLSNFESIGEKFRNHQLNSVWNNKNPLHEEVEEIYAEIISNFDLTDFQVVCLNDLLHAFHKIRVLIDPDKLKPFKVDMTEEGELCLYRNSQIGLTNIALADDELITYSFIPREGKSKLHFFEPELEAKVDFEEIAYLLFAN